MVLQWGSFLDFRGVLPQEDRKSMTIALTVDKEYYLMSSRDQDDCPLTFIAVALPTCQGRPADGILTFLVPKGWEEQLRAIVIDFRSSCGRTPRTAPCVR